MGALRKALKNHSLSFPDGPIVLPVPDASDPEERARLEKLESNGILDSEPHAWFRHDETHKDYVGLSDAFNYLGGILEKVRRLYKGYFRFGANIDFTGGPIRWCNWVFTRSIYGSMLGSCSRKWSSGP